MKENELLSLIDKYFQGETSLEEERELRRSLMETDSEHPSVTEAKAVLVYVAMAATGIGRSSKKADTYGSSMMGSSSMIERNGGSKLRWHRWSVAAAVAVLIAEFGLPMFLNNDKSLCSTMIACRIDNSQETAFNLISSQLEAVGYASDEVAEEVLDGLVLMSEY
ncbi:MAG: hypothetical protein K2H60_13670 [Muribaculaceae bacterium]|nr:hypothetical protein [Muribaculaceae bacterium]